MRAVAIELLRLLELMLRQRMMDHAIERVRVKAQRPWGAVIGYCLIVAALTMLGASLMRAPGEAALATVAPTPVEGVMVVPTGGTGFGAEPF